METTCLSLSSQTFKRWLAAADDPKTEAPSPGVSPHSRSAQRAGRGRVIAICVAVAVLAIGVRLLLWQDNRTNFPRVFSGMVEHHQDNARVLLRGEVSRFITGPAPPGDANILTYPPGYPIIMAIVFRIFNNAESSMRLFQVVCDAAAAVLLFFVAGQFLPRAAAIIAAVLAALSPQLAYYSLLLIPDSLATLPILLALYFLVRAVKTPRVLTLAAAGVCVGLSCWLRSNALLLAPFLAVVVFFVIKEFPASAATKKSARLRGALALLAASLVIIAPITIRNVIVFHRLVPLSLGAGQMLNVGISDYDKQREFDLPGTDLETVTREARSYDRPDYASSLFGGDGIERDQRRFENGLAVIRRHPHWFASVLLRRSASMFKLERVRPVAPEPAPSHSVSGLAQQSPVWTKRPVDLFGPNAGVTLLFPSTLGDTVPLVGPSDRPTTVFFSNQVAVERNTDYLIRVPISLEDGSLVASVQSNQRTIASSPVFHPLEPAVLVSQPTVMLELPFVSGKSESVTLVLSNEGKRPVQTIMKIGKMELYRLGPSSFGWTKYLRSIVNLVQRFFITAWILPLAIIGILGMWRAGKQRYLPILMAIPLYYVCAQSFLHTEYRYVMAIQYTLFVCVAATLYLAGCTLKALVRRGPSD